MGNEYCSVCGDFHELTTAGCSINPTPIQEVMGNIRGHIETKGLSANQFIELFKKVSTEAKALREENELLKASKAELLEFLNGDCNKAHKCTKSPIWHWKLENGYANALAEMKRKDEKLEKLKWQLSDAQTSVACLTDANDFNLKQCKAKDKRIEELMRIVDDSESDAMGYSYDLENTKTKLQSAEKVIEEYYKLRGIKMYSQDYWAQIAVINIALEVHNKLKKDMGSAISNIGDTPSEDSHGRFQSRQTKATPLNKCPKCKERYKI